MNSTIKHILIFTFCFCLVGITASISFYFLKILPDQKREALSLQAEEMRIKQAQIDIEKSKIEIQNRETNIKEEASQREADETARKLTQLKEQKAEVAKCEARTSSLILKAQQNAGCSGNSEQRCYFSVEDSSIMNANVAMCNDLKKKYNL